MPGILRNYKAGSIIYFIGDMGDEIYVLKSGAVKLEYHSIETGEVTQEAIKNGEFFGVKSSLAKRPREETAHVITDSQVLVLNAYEFERLVTKNVGIITQFLRVFSNQLRRMGKLAQSFLNHQSAGDNQGELFKIGEYYLKNHKYKQAQYVYETYLKHYAEGRYAAQAKERLASVKGAQEGKSLGAYSNVMDAPSSSGAVGGSAAVAAAQGSMAETAVDEGAGGADIATKYYDAVSLFSQERFEDAFRLFKQLHDSGAADAGARDYMPKIEFEMGRCLLALKKHKEAIVIFTTMIKYYPKDENLKEALFNIGVSYKLQGNKDKAILFFNKVLKMLPEGPVDRKAKKELSSIKG
ncbi:MAG: cyclic nucleotide-binding domain-containing protein [Spirochaetes bacterium]|nr:cyclic nucleotide-binding domain-containing protein [Spirochaetota bacterium]